KLKAPLSLEAGPNIMVNSVGENQISISRFNVGMADQKRIVSMRVDEVIRAIVDLGGTYPDAVQMLQNAKAAKSLPSRFEIDALPRAGRRYNRVAGEEPADAGEQGLDEPLGKTAAIGGVESPRDLESTTGDSSILSADPQNIEENSADSAKKRQPIKSFFAKMTGSE
ncbi:MAG: hypothetical protein U9N87_02880, partial [Planctomycetota bacterium]|nr:hypothetical protein [Planctomycetota bacterium]